jgi:hypothetical protein
MLVETLLSSVPTFDYVLMGAEVVELKVGII